MAPCAVCRVYRPNTEDYIHHYQQTGAGSSYPVFRGTPYQAGYGIGNILSNVFKGLVPVLKRGALTAAKTAAKSGAQAIGDVIEGKSIKEALKTRAIEGLHSVGRQARDAIIETVEPTKKRKKQHVMAKRSKKKKTTAFY